MLAEHRALARAIAEKQYNILLRYWINTAAGVVATYLVFVLLFLGGQQAAPDTMGQTLPAVIVGFFVWSMAYSGFQDPSRVLMQEAQWGTLEQLYMTPLGIGAVLAFRTVVLVVVSLGWGLLLLGVMMVTTSRYLAVDLVTVVPLAVLTLATAIGLGFAFGGLALIYKRIENVFLIVQFAFLAVLMAPAESFVVKLLPLRLGYELLTDAMERGIRIWELPAADLATAVAVALGYLVVGAVCLRYSIQVARTRGLMSDY